MSTRTKRMKSKMLAIAVVVAIVLCLSPVQSAPEGHGYKVIVNSANPVTSVSKDDLSRIFLKKTSKFGNGHAAAPVDLPASSPVREGFSKDVHGKSTSAVEAYWQQQIFSGRDVPPGQKSESAAVEFVRSNPNGVAYVSAGTATEGVKVVTVTN